MGINQLTFVKSCRHLVRLGSLSLCEYYYLYSKDTLFQNIRVASNEITMLDVSKHAE